MLTLKELKKIVKVADMEKRIPSVKSLKEHKVVVKEMINADTTISVYDHGYVLYTAGNQSTVFPLHSCDDYEYVSVTGDNKEFNKEFFDNENWYVLPLLVESDRMITNQIKIGDYHGIISYSVVVEDRKYLIDPSRNCLDDMIEKELIKEMMQTLTERQKEIIYLYFWEQMNQIITNVASDSYTLDWNAKPISIIAYPETKAESRLINEYIADSSTKFKRVIQPT